MLASFTPQYFTMISNNGNGCEEFITLGKGSSPVSSFPGKATMYPGKCDTKYWTFSHSV